MSGTDPMSFDEIAARLERAAMAELFGINELEYFAAKAADEDLTARTVVHFRRQALALGLARRIAQALAAQPGLAAGLGLNTAEFADLAALAAEADARQAS